MCKFFSQKPNSKKHPLMEDENLYYEQSKILMQNLVAEKHLQ